MVSQVLEILLPPELAVPSVTQAPSAQWASVVLLPQVKLVSQVLAILVLVPPDLALPSVTQAPSA